MFIAINVKNVLQMLECFSTTKPPFNTLSIKKRTDESQICENKQFLVHGQNHGLRLRNEYPRIILCKGSYVLLHTLNSLVNKETGATMHRPGKKTDSQSWYVNFVNITAHKC